MAQLLAPLLVSKQPDVSAGVVGEAGALGLQLPHALISPMVTKKLCFSLSTSLSKLFPLLGGFVLTWAGTEAGGHSIPSPGRRQAELQRASGRLQGISPDL